LKRQIKLFHGRLLFPGDGLGCFVYLRVDAGKSGTASVTVTAKQNLPYSDYFGTWRIRLPQRWDAQVTISADKIEWLESFCDYYTISGLTWTETKNPGGEHAANYPAGYKVTGTCAMFSEDYYSPSKVDGSGYCRKGDIALVTFYISADKKSIAMETNVKSVSYKDTKIYEKTTDIEYWQISYNLNGGEWMADDSRLTKIPKDARLKGCAHPFKGDFVFEGWYLDQSLNNRYSFSNYDLLTSNITLHAKWSSKTHLQTAVYSMGYSIQIANWVADGQKPTGITGVLTVNYGGTTTQWLSSVYISSNSTYVPYWADNGRRRPEYISGTQSEMADTKSIRDGAYDYARDFRNLIACFDQYQPNNPYISLSNLQKITNNSAITQIIYDNIRGVLPSYSYKMIVFGINDKKELMGKYIGYTFDGKTFHYCCVDPKSSEFGKFAMMNSPIY